jgi:hypothetical protein
VTRAALAGLLTLLLARSAVGAAGGGAPPPQQTKSKAPRTHNLSYSYDVLDNSVVRPATRVLDVARLMRKASFHPREAANVDQNDEVRLPSTWWQPRVGFRVVTVEQMMHGPGPGTGPAPGRWTVSHPKDQGVTPGFQVKDSKGDKFVVKFDAPGWSELSTGAAAIGSRLFWAAGYNVPDDAIATFRAEDLDIDPKATYKDSKGKEHPITREYLNQVLSRVARQPDGSYRCIASRYLPGQPLGPFEYRGRRSDDPEDRIPHELRRELRGLWTMCAWANHADSRAPNSLDMWTTENGRSFVRHYLIDFSAILGAGPGGPRAYQTGWEYYVDFNRMAEDLAAFGFVPFAWEGSVDPRMPSVGFVESKAFDPEHWRPDYPNPAFDERTVSDIRWGARIVAGFTDDQIRAAVSTARFSDPRAAEYVTRVLIERRDKIVHQWLRDGLSAARAGR